MTTATALADVVRAFDRTVNKFTDSAGNVEIHVQALSNIGEQFEKAHDQAKVQDLKEAALAIIRLQKVNQDSAAVLRRLQTSYAPKVDVVTDFPALLTQGLQEREAADSYDPAKTDLYLELEEDIGEVHGTGAAAATQRADGDDSDDDVVLEATQGGQLAPNSKCPLSGKQLLDINVPVMDSKGFVYEKADIEGYIKRQRTVGEYVKCPEHGTSHRVALKDLKPARRVVKAKRRQKANPNAGRGGNQRATQLDIIDM
ncbi:hypothetical protein WJX73_005777 [Symbiochloris irregularis]|uniref:SP-RING-type domain-containing protein n=1 Tax=Symbiochloris irregularis TaxID=706552 RepID=A0AAW1NIN5_9CHLO